MLGSSEDPPSSLVWLDEEFRVPALVMMMTLLESTAQQ